MVDIDLIIKEAIEFNYYISECPNYRKPIQYLTKKDLTKNLFIGRWSTESSRDESQLKVGKRYKTYNNGYVILPFNTTLNLIKLNTSIEDGMIGPKIVGHAEIEEIRHKAEPAEKDGIIYRMNRINTVKTEITFKVLELYSETIENKHLNTAFS